jgi:hypothetical protein
VKDTYREKARRREETMNFVNGKTSKSGGTGI